MLPGMSQMSADFLLFGMAVQIPKHLQQKNFLHYQKLRFPVPRQLQHWMPQVLPYFS